MLYRRARAVAALLCLATVLAAQQAAPAPPVSDTVLRATTHMVLVDAVVLDHAGNPVTNLSQADFVVLEDGTRQRIATFSVHQAEAKTDAKPLLLPPHVASNRPEVVAPEGPGTTAVLLLDGLNTPPQQQVYVKQQMLKFLAEHFDPRIRIEVIALSNTLTVLQSFTSDASLLRAALLRYQAGLPALARTPADNNIASTTATAASHSITAPAAANAPSQANSSSDPGGVESAGGSNSSIADDIAYMMRRFEKESENFSRDVRISTTLAALENIARHMSGQPGRKVLLWFSAGFPISVSGTQPEDIETARQYGDEVRRTTNLLNDAHVSIYSIDASTLISSALADPANSGRDQTGRVALGIDANKALAKDAFQRFATEDALQRVAADTGGRYFGNRNDLDHAIEVTLKESSSYYMLGYYPSNKKWDGKFRRIQVKVARDGVQVRQRAGYYAMDPLDWRKGNHDKDLASALKAESLAASQVLFMARALPPARNADVEVEFAVDANTISFESGVENQHYCNLNFEVQAFTPDGQLVRAEVQSAEAPLRPQSYERIRKQGLPMKVPIRLTAGKYTLRLGVRDNRTGLFGTAELPIEVPR